MSDVLELETLGGNHISDVCKQAARKTSQTGKAVHFEFNGIHVTAQPGESAATIECRWNADIKAAEKAYREDPQRKVEQAEREAKDRAARAAHMIESSATETEMREAKVPWPLTKEQLAEYIESLVNRTHDYGTCVYAMSMAAVAAFHYVAHHEGVTGFQASCANLDIIRRTRSIDGPFMLIQAHDALYPQYDLPGKLAEALEKWKPWLKEEAQKKLADSDGLGRVAEHWKKLAGDESA